MHSQSTEGLGLFPWLLDHPSWPASLSLVSTLQRRAGPSLLRGPVSVYDYKVRSSCEVPLRPKPHRLQMLHVLRFPGGWAAQWSILCTFTVSSSPVPSAQPVLPVAVLVSVGTGSGTARTMCVTPRALLLAWPTTSPSTGSNICSPGSASMFWCR